MAEARILILQPHVRSNAEPEPDIALLASDIIALVEVAQTSRDADLM